MSKTLFIITRTISNSLILGSLAFLTLSIGPVIKEEVFFYYREISGKTYTLDPTQDQEPSKPLKSLFAGLAYEPTPIKITPASTEFGIVIEKLGVNAPIVANVSPNSSEAYFEALKYGVAHAGGTAFPGQTGNSYLFAHSALDFWNFGKYATVFTLLHQLKPEDKIVVFYKEERFDYEVIDLKIVSGFNTIPLVKNYGEPILTLQTCNPPGTALNRLIVTARLVKN